MNLDTAALFCEACDAGAAILHRRDLENAPANVLMIELKSPTQLLVLTLSGSRTTIYGSIYLLRSSSVEMSRSPGWSDIRTVTGATKSRPASSQDWRPISTLPSRSALEASKLISELRNDGRVAPTLYTHVCVMIGDREIAALDAFDPMTGKMDS